MMKGSFAGNVLVSTLEGRTGLFLVCMDVIGREGQGKEGCREGMREAGTGLSHLCVSHTVTRQG